MKPPKFPPMRQSLSWLAVIVLLGAMLWTTAQGSASAGRVVSAMESFQRVPVETVSRSQIMIPDYTTTWVDWQGLTQVVNTVCRENEPVEDCIERHRIKVTAALETFPLVEPGQ